ncbi:MAG: hypothetical protein CG441_1915, partial [Methylococcaceae bacterium NSM2-1]
MVQFAIRFQEGEELKLMRKKKGGGAEKQYGAVERRLDMAE